MPSITKPSIGRDVAFFNGGLNNARLGFGCASLMQAPLRRHRQRLLDQAFELGIRHFDVARMYGLGAAEGELGRFARGRRDQITIATKFGIDPSGPVGSLARLQAPARAAIARFPTLRTALKRRQDAFHQPRRYDPESARASLHKSLKELGTEYVDLFLVHDPGAADPIEIEHLVETLEELCRDGSLRAWGFSGECEHCVRLRDAVDVPTVLQVRDDIFTRAPARLDAEPILTFGVLSKALDRTLAQLDDDERWRTRWSDEMGRDWARKEVVASLLIQDAIDRNPGGGVLFSTTRANRLKVATVAAEALGKNGPAMVRAFRDMVLDNSGTPGVADVK